MAKPQPDTGDFTVSTDETIRMEARRLGVIGFTALLLVLGGLAIASYYAWHLDGQLFGIVGVALFLGACVALVYIRIRQNRQGSAGSFVLSPDGVSVPGFKGKLVPWSEITGIDMMNIRGVQAIVFGITDKAQNEIGRSKLMKGISNATSRFEEGGDIAVPVTLLPIALGDFVVMSVTYAAAHSNKAWASEMFEELTKRQAAEAA